MEEDLRKKSILTLGGAVLLPEGYTLPYRVSRSTAGPGAGYGSFAFSFGGYRVKKSFSYEEGEFELHVSDDGSLSLTHRGERFLDSIEIVPIVRHCPGQAFFNLDPRCIFHCVYCNSPLLDMSEDKHLSTEKILSMLEESDLEHDFQSISFTSGVVGSIGGTVDRFAEVVSAVKERYPDRKIGIEPYVSDRAQIEKLKAAGADEIKLNIECADKTIFEKVCPDLDYDLILEMLEEAVDVFGKGSVLSNIIFGLGESDEDLEGMMDRLCSIGVIPCLRALRTNGLNNSQLREAIGDVEPVSSERVMKLAEAQKRIMREHGFDDMPSHTMCMECGCCDLVPFRDL